MMAHAVHVLLGAYCLITVCHVCGIQPRPFERRKFFEFLCKNHLNPIICHVFLYIQVDISLIQW